MSRRAGPGHHRQRSGTYSPDRQPTLIKLLLEPARRCPYLRFAGAGPQYRSDNVEQIEHLPPAEHARFYSASRMTLSITRADMIAADRSPSVWLFEAGAFGTPIVSDRWGGIESLFGSGREIVLADSTEDVIHALARPSGHIGQVARPREYLNDYRNRAQVADTVIAVGSEDPNYVVVVDEYGYRYNIEGERIGSSGPDSTVRTVGFRLDNGPAGGRRRSCGGWSISVVSLTSRLLAAAALTLSAAACDVLKGRQGIAAYAADSAITNNIRARFLDDPMVHFGEVDVTTLNGNVQLTGRVNSERERHRAAQIARAVNGVHSVDNDIALR